MSEIRVTYSGLIAFVVGLISIFTGLVFVLIVTRRLTPEEFGTWSLLGTMLAYFLISEKIVSYWTTRQIARDEEIAKTSIFSSITFALGSIPLYLVFAYYVSTTNNANLETMLFGALLLPAFFISQTLMSINLGFRPQVTSYGLLIFEITKIPAALGFVFYFDLGVEGAIVAVVIAYISRIGLQCYFARQKFRTKIELNVLKRWFKLSWVPVYSHITILIFKTDVILYTILTGSVVGLAFYTAAYTVARIIEHSASVTQALYPKLLAKGSPEYIKENYELLMYFSIPLLGLSIIFSKAAVFALNPAYEAASIVVIALAFRSFFLVLVGPLHQILRGLETVDVETNPKFSNLAKSQLVLVPTVRNIQYVLYLVTLTTVLLVLISNEASELELVTWWAIIAASFEVPFLIYFLLQVRKKVQFSFPYVKTLKYTAAMMAFIIIFFVTSDSLIKYEISIYDFLPGVLIQVAICVGVYLAITYLIDNKIRTLFKAILNELSSNKR